MTHVWDPAKLAGVPVGHPQLHHRDRDDSYCRPLRVLRQGRRDFQSSQVQRGILDSNEYGTKRVALVSLKGEVSAILCQVHAILG